MFIETKKRSLTKATMWRIIAILNSYFVLTFSISKDNLVNAILMNISGFIIYYLYERIWNKISWEKNKMKEL